MQCQLDKDGKWRESGNSIPVSRQLFAYEWDRLHAFARRVRWKVIFCLNVQLRSEGEWNSSNAAMLVDYNAKRGYNTAWELGNGGFIRDRNVIHFVTIRTLV